MHGILILDKPEGVICQKLLNQIKRCAGKIKIGHTGTLDPFASGVLPIFLGEATKLIPHLDENQKTYEATLKLGEATDTMDRDGRLIFTAPIPPLSPDQVVRTLKQQVGKQQQIPPAYSAIKKEGVPLYHFARRGIKIDVPPREVNIFSIEMMDFSPPLLRFKAEVSKGTYLRSLGLKIAEDLNTTGHLIALRRLQSGAFNLNRTVNEEELNDLLMDLPQFQEVIEKQLHQVLKSFPQWRIESEMDERYFLQGRAIDAIPSENIATNQVILVKTQNRILGMGKWRQKAEQGWEITPVRIITF